MEKERHINKPPLGEIVDLNRIEVQRLLDWPFENAEKNELYGPVIEIAKDVINQIRRNIGLGDVVYGESDIRLITKEHYDVDFILSQGGENGAFFNPATKNIFVRIDPDIRHTKFEEMRIMYSIIHEMGHKAMDKGGISKLFEDGEIDFHMLNEGIVEFIAKRILNGHVFPKIKPNFMEIQKDFVEKAKPDIDGLELRSDDIIPTAPDEDQSGYGHLVGLRAVEFLKENYPEVFETLLKLAFQGDAEQASILIEEKFGREIRDALNGRDKNPLEPLNLLIKTKGI